jgi:prophage antirepressor-like protein
MRELDPHSRKDLNMDALTTNFSEFKVGLLTLYVAISDGQLVFHSGQLIKQLKIEPELLNEQFDPCIVIDKDSEVHTVVCEEDLYHLVLSSEAKVARQFQNWVLHCVLPAVLLDRFYFVGEEQGGTSSDLTLDPKAPFYGLPDAHVDWIARRVIPTIREEGGFYTDHEAINPMTVPSKRQQTDCMMGVNGQAKLARFHQQASLKRFARIARQFRQMQETTALPEMTSQWEAEFEVVDDPFMIWEVMDEVVY